MSYGDTEFYEVQAQFEKGLKATNSVYVSASHKFEKVHRDDRARLPKSIFYQNGEVNSLFHAFMSGYGFAVCRNQS